MRAAGCPGLYTAIAATNSYAFGGPRAFLASTTRQTCAVPRSVDRRLQAAGHLCMQLVAVVQCVRQFMLFCRTHASPVEPPCPLRSTKYSCVSSGLAHTCQYAGPTASPGEFCLAPGRVNDLTCIDGQG